MAKRKPVVHRAYYRSNRTNCNKIISSNMVVVKERFTSAIDFSKPLVLEEVVDNPEITCKLCKGIKTPMQDASYTRYRLLGDFGMVVSCLRRIQAVTGQKIDEANLTRLRASINEWYAAKKVEYSK